MTNHRVTQYQKAANNQTLFCIASTVPLLLFVMIGPKEGMETLGILIPWFFAGTVNLTVGSSALVNTIKTKAHLLNIWIYLYFFSFFLFHAIFLVIANGVDISIARNIDDYTQQDESELWHILTRYDTARTLEQGVARARELVSQGVDLSYIRPGSQDTMISLATRKGDPELVRMMLERGADVTGPVSARRAAAAPLMLAVRDGHTAVVSVLLEFGAQPNNERLSHSPLNLAVKNRDFPTARLLLDADASDLSTALESAIGDSRMIELLLEYGADPNITLNGKKSLVLRSVYAECVDCVRILVRAGGKAFGPYTLYKNRDEPPLVYAINHGQNEIVEILSSSTIYPSSSDDLRYAIDNQDLQMLETLLTLGVPPDAHLEEYKGHNMLHYISTRLDSRSQLTNVPAAQILVAYGADIEALDKYGRTPLHSAAGNGVEPMVLFLMERGADINAVADNGLAPLGEAIYGGHEVIASILREAGAKFTKLYR